MSPTMLTASLVGSKVNLMVSLHLSVHAQKSLAHKALDLIVVSLI